MTNRRTRVEWQWSKRSNDSTYHYVSFTYGCPNATDRLSACGLVDRFWPRVGIRMNDLHCRPCLAVATEENAR